MKQLILFLLFIFVNNQLLKSQNNDFRNFAPTLFPDRIMMTIPGNPATSRAVTWRTVYSDSISIGEISAVNAAPQLEVNKTTVQGAFSPWESGSIHSMGHRVVFDNLRPKTKYAYRVGDGKNWSEWFQFVTSSDITEPFSFLYFGDVQNDIKSYCSRTLREAFSHFPESSFMLFAGDLVSSSREDYWREFFYAGGWIWGMIPSVPTPGNHEYDGRENQSVIFSKHWNQIYQMPENGPAKKYINRFYYFDYQGARFVSFDSPALGESPEDRPMILDWLDKTLKENPNRWSVVFTHYPVYSCSQGRENKEYRDAIKPILEKYGVDLVLQGHDHTYCRGQNLIHVADQTKNSPVYIVSVAGPKMYGLNVSFWSDRMASNTQLYQHITFQDNTLTFQSFTVAGDLYDEFQIIKNKNGKNRVIESEKIKQIKERTEIPEGAKKNYTEEEMQKYRMQFSKSK